MRPVVFLLVAATLSPAAYPQSAAMRGFLTKDVPDEQKLEQQAQTIPEAAHLRKYVDFLAGAPHHAGSPRSKAVAEYILGALKEWGLDAQIEQFEALLPYPTVRQVEVIGPRPYVAKLREPAVPEDPNSADAGGLPPYNAYAASGDVTGGRGVRQFRCAGGLRVASKAGDRRQGQDRNCSLWQELARYQA